MITVRTVSDWLEAFAPSSLAEAWDNVGLLWGDSQNEVQRVMTCLTVTPETAMEAIEEHANLIVSHHPVLFRPVKRIVAGASENGFLWALARAGVSILSPHTAFDNTRGGINDGLARRLGLIGVEALRAPKLATPYKIVVFTPEADAEMILQGAFARGAGTIGAYDGCSFRSQGEGTFVPGAGANPSLGSPGLRSVEPESRLELVCPEACLDAVIQGIRENHRYEEPAIDVYPLRPGPAGPGSGRIGELPGAVTLNDLARQLERTLGTSMVRFVGDGSRSVKRIAIVCGAGEDFLMDAVKAKADVFLTGETRFHRALEAEALGIGMIVVGHYASERPGVEDLANAIRSAYPELKVWASQREHEPFQACPPR